LSKADYISKYRWSSFNYVNALMGKKGEFCQQTAFGKSETLPEFPYCWLAWKTLVSFTFM
jgi:hypothetical protein